MENLKTWLESRWNNPVFLRRYEPLMCVYHCETVAEVVKRLEPDTRIWGFADDENPGTKYFDGHGEDGHHFAVVADRFICDPWMFETEAASVFDMEDPASQGLIREIYGDRAKWTEITRPWLCTVDEDFPDPPARGTIATNNAELVSHEKETNHAGC